MRVKTFDRAYLCKKCQIDIQIINKDVLVGVLTMKTVIISPTHSSNREKGSLKSS